MLPVASWTYCMFCSSCPHAQCLAPAGQSCGDTAGARIVWSATTSTEYMLCLGQVDLSTWVVIDQHTTSATKHWCDSDTGWHDLYTGLVHVTFKHGGAQGAKIGTSLQVLKILPAWQCRQMKNEFCHSVCFSGLPWAWRCTSCSSFIASSYLLRHVLTTRLRTVSWRLIRRRPKLLTINSSSHDIKFIKLCSRNRCSFIKIVVAYVLSPRSLPGNPRFSALPLWTFAAIVGKFNPGLVPLYFAEKKTAFCQFFPINGLPNLKWSQEWPLFFSPASHWKWYESVLI